METPKKARKSRRKPPHLIKPSGRPPKRFKGMPKEKDLETIQALAGYGLSVEKIAVIYGVSKDTFNRYMIENPDISAAMEKGRAQAEAAVTQSAYDQAVSGKAPHMTQFWLRCRARWKDTTGIEHSGTVDVNTKAEAMGFDERAERIRELAASLGYAVVMPGDDPDATNP